MIRISTLLGSFASLVCLSAFACSSAPEGSTVGPPSMGSGGKTGNGTGATANGSGGSSTGSGASGSFGSTGSGTGSVSSGSSSGTGSNSSVGTVDACPGLPIVRTIPEEPMARGGAGGQGGVAGQGAAGEPGLAGAGGAGGANGENGEGGAAGAAEIAMAQDNTGGTASGEEPSCIGVSVEAEAIPVDMFIMMDRSQSMGYLIEGTNQTRWEALRKAVREFVSDPKAAKIGGGIGFFSLSGNGDDQVDCSSAAYAKPKVAIGPLAQTGPSLVAAIEGVTPAGFTPALPALEGAIAYAKTWAQEHKDRATVVVFVSDGFPTQCSKAPDIVANAAKSGYESEERIRTFVVGVGDYARFNLDNYARSGGTKKAFLTDAVDVSSSFVSALNNITNSKLDCDYKIPLPPEGQNVDAEKVQVVYTPSTGSAQEVPRIDNVGQCATQVHGGWYYDDPQHPTKISVCPCSCEQFQAGRVDVRLGCKPRLGLR